MKKYCIVLAAVLIFTLCLCGCTGSGASSCENAVKNLFNASIGDLDAYKKCVPDFVLKAQLVEMDMTEEEFWEIAEGQMAELREIMEESYGKNVKVSVKIEDKEELDDDALETMKKQLKEKYGQEFDVSAGYTVVGEITIKGDEKKAGKDFKLNAYKIGGRWYAM